jgi:hypothetical protein
MAKSGLMESLVDSVLFSVQDMTLLRKHTLR